MANKALVNYIAAGLKKGYSAASLRNYLVQQGYQPGMVDLAIMEANGKPGAKGFLIFFMLLVIIAAGVVVYIVKIMPEQDSSALPVFSSETSLPDDSFKPVQKETIPITTAEKATPAKSVSDKTVGDASLNTPTTIRDNDDVETITINKGTIEITSSATTAPDFTTTRSVNDCEVYSDDNRDKCIMEFSWQKDHDTFCERIIKPSLKDDCYSRYALRHESKAGCDKIDNTYSREICVYYLMTADKLSTLKVQYTIDPKKPDIIFDEKLAMQKLSSPAGKQAINSASQ